MYLTLVLVIGLHTVHVNQLDWDRYMVSEVGYREGGALQTVKYRWQHIKLRPGAILLQLAR